MEIGPRRFQTSGKGDMFNSQLFFRTMLTLSLAKRKRKSEPSSTAQCCSTVWSTSAARIRRCSERLGCDVQMTAARFSGFLPLQLPLLNSGNDSSNIPSFGQILGHFTCLLTADVIYHLYVFPCLKWSDLNMLQYPSRQSYPYMAKSCNQYT